jgi:hypothetical protein
MRQLAQMGGSGVSSNGKGPNVVAALDYAREFSAWLRTSRDAQERGRQDAIARGLVNRDELDRQTAIVMAYDAMIEKIDLIERVVVEQQRMIRSYRRKAGRR